MNNVYISGGILNYNCYDFHGCENCPFNKKSLLCMALEYSSEHDMDLTVGKVIDLFTDLVKVYYNPLNKEIANSCLNEEIKKCVKT